MADEFMKQVEFAKLCGVSRQMVSKYAQAGRLEISATGAIAAKDSLIRLEGHLDENKRRDALMRLAGIEMPKHVVAFGKCDERSHLDQGADSESDNSQPDNVVSFSWKAKKERAEAQIRELDLAERMGQLVAADDVRAAVEDAVATFWSEVDRGRSMAVAGIAAELRLDTNQASELRILMARRDTEFRAAYTERMREKASEIASQAGRDAQISSD